MPKISALPTDSSPTTTDTVPVVDVETGVTKKTTLSSLISLFFGNIPANTIENALNTIPISQNYLINGAMEVWQRNTTAAANDDVYSGADRWNFLTETNGAWTVARDDSVPSTGGSRYSMKCSNVTLNNQMAIVQILENKDALKLVGKNVTLSFQAKTTGTEITNLRAAILSWTGTADSVTSDVIGTWAQGGTNPTWATNWTMENTPSNIALTSSWQRFNIENIAIDTASTANVAVVIWVDDGTIAAGDDFWVTQVQLIEGAEPMTFPARLYEEELALCQRYYQNYVDTNPSYRVYHNNVNRLSVPLSTFMRISPTVTKTFSGSGMASDGTTAMSGMLVYDTQFTGGGVGVVDGNYTVLKLDAEL